MSEARQQPPGDDSRGESGGDGERARSLAVIGNGRDDPRRWVQAAYLLIDAMDSDPDGKPPSRAEIAAKLGIHQATVARAYRELRALGIVRHVPGHGVLRGQEASQSPPGDAGLVVITITLPEGTDARVRVTSASSAPCIPSTTCAARGLGNRCGCQTGYQKLEHLQEAHVTTPPDFGGRDIEEGILEDLGGPRPEHAAGHEDEDSSTWSDNEAHAPGMVCELCGAVITAGQDVRRRADGQWMHEVCP